MHRLSGFVLFVCMAAVPARADPSGGKAIKAEVMRVLNQQVATM